MEENSYHSPSPVQSEKSWNADVFKAYEEGKHRRYNLLFAVNGGAFTVAKLFADPAQQMSTILGNLDLWQFSVGMVCFTIIMVLDIFMFGHNMRKQMQGLFSWQGKLVLIVIGLLLSAGWTLVSFSISELVLVIVVYLSSITIVYFLLRFTKLG